MNSLKWTPSSPSLPIPRHLSKWQHHHWVAQARGCELSLSSSTSLAPASGYIISISKVSQICPLISLHMATPRPEPPSSLI